MAKYLEQLKLIKNSKDQKILVLGLGVENQQFLEWLLKIQDLSPDKIILADKKPITLEFAKVEDFECFFGDNYLESLQQLTINMVIKAPGIWSLRPELEEFRKLHGHDSILSSLTFFMEEYREQIIGVTGTKGKTTTSSLIYYLLKDDHEIYYCGNTTGISPYQFWENSKAYFIIELSSFQLQDLAYAKISPKFAVVTNYFIDHLDQHGTKEEYWKAKDAIFEFQTLDDYFVAHDQIWNNIQKREIDSEASFEFVKYTTGYPDNEFMLTKILEDGISLNFKTKLLGEHNVQNLCLALIICECVEISKTDKSHKPNLAEVLKRLMSCRLFYHQRLLLFEPIHGRLELVKTIIKNGVTINFYNDNAATEPDAVTAALRALTQNPAEKLYLICGGKIKQGDYEDLVYTLWDKISSNLIFKMDLLSEVGQELDRIDKTLFDNPVASHGLSAGGNVRDFLNTKLDLGELLNSSRHTGFKTLNILFSPGGSSFNEFKNYFEREKLFLEWVERTE